MSVDLINELVEAMKCMQDHSYEAGRAAHACDAMQTMDREEDALECAKIQANEFKLVLDHQKCALSIVLKLLSEHHDSLALQMGWMQKMQNLTTGKPPSEGQ